jgi:hypothetical protein
MPNPDGIQIFHCASGIAGAGATIEKVLGFKR